MFLESSGFGSAKISVNKGHCIALRCHDVDPFTSPDPLPLELAWLLITAEPLIASQPCADFCESGECCNQSRQTSGAGGIDGLAVLIVLGL